MYCSSVLPRPDQAEARASVLERCPKRSPTSGPRRSQERILSGRRGRALRRIPSVADVAASVRVNRDVVGTPLPGIQIDLDAAGESRP